MLMDLLEETIIYSVDLFRFSSCHFVERVVFFVVVLSLSVLIFPNMVLFSKLRGVIIGHHFLTHFAASNLGSLAFTVIEICTGRNSYHKEFVA